jgi:hypothetical protein
MAGERELTTGLLAKEASFRLKIRTHRRASQAQEGAPRSRARGFGPALTPPVRASSLSP